MQVVRVDRPKVGQPTERTLPRKSGARPESSYVERGSSLVMVLGLGGVFSGGINHMSTSACPRKRGQEDEQARAARDWPTVRGR